MGGKPQKAIFPGLSVFFDGVQSTVVFNSIERVSGRVFGISFHKRALHSSVESRGPRMLRETKLQYYVSIAAGSLNGRGIETVLDTLCVSL